MLESILQALYRVFHPVIALLGHVWDAIKSLKDTKIGRIMGWSAFGSVFSYITGVFWAGVKPALQMFQSMATDPQSAFAGMPQGGMFSLAWFWDAASAVVPSAVRWFLWFIGGDWWVWLAMSALLLWFAGWLLDKVAGWMGAIVERVCQLL